MTEIPNIDKIFEEGREPTEEEWKIWAENFKPKTITARRAEHEARLTKKKAKIALYDRERKKREYRNRKETGHKSWGRKYNQKRTYLYKYNQEYRNKLHREGLIKAYKKSAKRYDGWINQFRKYYKGKLDEHASTFKLGDDIYVYGFTKNQLRELSPLTHRYFKLFLEEQIFPEPKYSGRRFKKKTLSTKEEKFYLLTEAIEFLGIFDKFRNRIPTYTEKRKAFLKKKFWEQMLQARKEFDNE